MVRLEEMRDQPGTEREPNSQADRGGVRDREKP